MLEDSYSNKDTIYMKMYITVEPLYNEVLGLTNYFFYSSNSKIYLRQYEKEPRYKFKKTSLQRTCFASPLALCFF